MIPWVGATWALRLLPSWELLSVPEIGSRVFGYGKDLRAARIQGRGLLRFVPEGLSSWMLTRQIFLDILLPDAQVGLGA